MLNRTRRRNQESSSNELYSFCYLDTIQEEISSPRASQGVINGKIKTDPNAKVIVSDTGIQYYEIPPEGTERCMVLTQFYRLKNNAKKWMAENIELRYGMWYLVYSPYSKKYYLRQVHDLFNPKRLKQYVNDKNVFLINKDQK